MARSSASWNSPQSCGNDPVWFYRFRLNLSDFAGLVDPGGIDASIGRPDVIECSQRHAYDWTFVSDGTDVLLLERHAERVREVWHEIAPRATGGMIDPARRSVVAIAGQGGDNRRRAERSPNGPERIS